MPVSSCGALAPPATVDALPSPFEEEEETIVPETDQISSSYPPLPARHAHRIDPRQQNGHAVTQSFSGLQITVDEPRGAVDPPNVNTGVRGKRSARLSGLFRHRSRDTLREPRLLQRPPPVDAHRSFLPSHENKSPNSVSGGANWLMRAASATFRGRRRSTFGETSSPQRRPLLGTTQPFESGQNSDPFGARRGGEAARAAAAASNEVLVGTAARSSPPLFSQMQQLPRDVAANLRRVKSSDNESGIGIDLQEEVLPAIGSEVFADTMVRVDPSTLPEELFHHILSYLDAEALMRAECVSRRWHTTAGSRAMWRGTFAKDYGSRAAIARAAAAREGGTTQIGGLGFGTRRADQDFKTMWKARQALDARWRTGRAAALYLNGHSDSVYCVQFDETKIVTGSRDRTVRVWDLHTLECIRVLGVEKIDSLTATGPAPLPPPPVAGARHVGGGGGRGTQNQRQQQAPQPEQKRPIAVRDPACPGAGRGAGPAAQHGALNHHGSVLCLQFDATTMVTGSSDTSLIVWDISGAQWRPVRRLVRHRAGVLDVCFDAKRIVSCSKDATICVWDRTDGSPVARLLSHQGPVNAVQLRGELLVSASGDGVAKLWNLASETCVREFPSRDRGLACVEFSPDSRAILAGGNDQVVYHFDASSGKTVRELVGHTNLVRSLHLDCVNGRVISGSYDYSVKAYDLATGDLLCDFVGWTASWILSAKADYRRIVATSQDGRVVVMDFGHGLKDVELLDGVER